MFIRNLTTILVLCFAMLSSLAASAEPYKRGDKLLSKTQLEEHGPVTFPLKNGGGFRVISVAYLKDPARDCKLHIPELRKMMDAQSNTAEWKKKKKKPSVPITFELKAEVVEGLGTLVCYGAGTGCTVTIEGKV